MSAATAIRDGTRDATARRPGADPPTYRLPTALEERLLLLTAGGTPNDGAIRAAAAGAVDWQRFLGLAQLERAVPVIHPRLRAIAGDLVPPDVLEQMRRLALVSDFAMLHLESRLRESIGVLDRARVRVMLLKGAALANGVYTSVRQRPMSDLDLLVDPSNAHVARRLMLGAGWREIVGGIPDAVYERHHHLPPMCDERSPQLQLEIHTALFPERQPFAFDARDLWARARSLGPTFSDAFVPDPSHSLLHACLHFLWSHQGRFGVWRTIRDVAAIVQNGAVDWTAFVAAARASRGGTSCYWTFRIAQVTAGVAVPEAVLDELRPPRRSYLLHVLERHLLMNLFPVQYACPSVALDHALWELAVMPAWSGHGSVRPWDAEAEFVVPTADSAEAPTARRDRFRRFLASPGYLGSLLRPATRPRIAR